MKSWKTDDTCPVCGNATMDFIESSVEPEANLFGEPVNVHYGILKCHACKAEIRASCFDYQVPSIEKHYDPKQDIFAFRED